MFSTTRRSPATLRMAVTRAFSLSETSHFGASFHGCFSSGTNENPIPYPYENLSTYSTGNDHTALHDDGGFDFPGRKGKYSTMKYHYRQFNGVDWDESRKQHAVYKTSKPRKDWAQDVSDEHGNYDFLMFANLDNTNPEVRVDIFKWAEWIGAELSISCMRIDAAKHYSVGFQKEFVNHLRNTVGTQYFIVSEYWRGYVRHLLNYLKVMEYGVSLFDVPLLGRFAVTSKMEGSDLRKVLRGTLVEQSPAHAVVSFSD